MKCFSDGVDAARDAYLATAKGPSTHVYLADMLATDVHKVRQMFNLSTRVVYPRWVNNRVEHAGSITLAHSM